MDEFGSNRTFMELKYRRNITLGFIISNSSNRTFMELKLCYNVSIFFVILRSNRTFMELKFI